MEQTAIAARAARELVEGVQRHGKNNRVPSPRPVSDCPRASVTQTVLPFDILAVRRSPPDVAGDSMADEYRKQWQTEQAIRSIEE